MKFREMIRRRILLVLTVFLLAPAAMSVEAAAQSLRDDAALDNALVKAAQAYAEADYGGVLACLEPISERYPEEGSLWYYIGMSRLYLRDFESGTEALGKAVALDPGNYWYRYYYNLARVYYTEDPDEGIAGYEDLLKDYPTRTDLNYQLADIYVRTGRDSAALALLGKIEELTGRDETITLYRYEMLSSLGRDDEAEETLVSFNQEFPSPRVLNELGTFYQAHDRDSLALGAFSAARSLDPSDLQAASGVSESLLSLGREDEYFAFMQQLLSDSSTPATYAADYLKNQSNPYVRRQFKHPERIDSLAETAVALHPSDSTLLRPAGLYFHSIGNTERARALFLQNALAYPNDWDQRIYYIQYLVFIEDYPAASKAADAAFDENPGELRYLDLKNYIDYQQKDYESLIRTSEKLMSLTRKGSDEYVTAYASIGDIYHEMGKDKEAFKIYKKVLKLRPDYAPTLNNYAYYLSQQGKKLNKAYTMSKKTVELEPDNATYLDTFGWILHLMGKDIEAKPIFKQAMLYGGQDSAVILDHYADVLTAMKERDLAKIYWRQALLKAGDDEAALKEAIRQKLADK